MKIRKLQRSRKHRHYKYCIKFHYYCPNHIWLPYGKEILESLELIRNSFGKRCRIISHNEFMRINTKVYVETEEDMLLIMFVHSPLIYKIYEIVD